MKKTYSFRLTVEMIERARELGLDVTKIIEAAVAKAINEKKCPYCKSRLESK